MILNARKVGTRAGPGQVYVGRPSKWGNPFAIPADGTRDEVIEKYRNWLAEQPDLLLQLYELHGKDLICWCAPEACHAEVLQDLARRSGVKPT
jgi:hypothetical protein